MADQQDDDQDQGGWRKLGGATVHIGPGGMIDAGCPGLEGTHVDDLDETREARDQEQDAAQAAGWQSAESQEAEAAHAEALRTIPPGTLAFIRIGDKYRTFGEHAGIARQVLQMGDGQEAEFDHEHLEDHLQRLVAAGHRVALLEKVGERPPAHTAAVGPEHAGTLDEDEATEDSDPGRQPHLDAEQARSRVEAIRAGDARSKNQGRPSREPPTGPLVEVDLPTNYFDQFSDPDYGNHTEFIRATTDPQRVSEYAGQKIDTPIYVTQRRGRAFVSDGGHRLAAAIQRGDSTIKALVSPEHAKEIAAAPPPAADEKALHGGALSPRPFDKPLGEHPNTTASDAAHHATYFDAEGRQIAKSRETPSNWSRDPVPVGTWRRDSWSGLYGTEMEQLQEHDPHSLVLSEDDYYATSANPEGRGWDADRYAEWIRQGHEPPPIHAIETESGKLRVTDGHRRLAAHKKAGLGKIKVWVSPITETGKIDSNGKPIKTGVTYETMIRDALARGEEVPEHAQKHYAEWLARQRGNQPPAATPQAPPTPTEGQGPAESHAATPAADKPASTPAEAPLDSAGGARPPVAVDDEATDAGEQPGIHDEPEEAEPHPAVEAAKSQLGRAPRPIRHALEAMHRLPDVQQHGAGSTDQLSAGYAQALYDHLRSTPGRTDDFGQVHDLSEHLGPGAIGYHSPAGTLALVPPQWEGGRWEARYAATQPEPEPELDEWGQPVTGDAYEGDAGEDLPPEYLEAQRAEATQALQSLMQRHAPQRRNEPHPLAGMMEHLEEAFPGDPATQHAVAEEALAYYQPIKERYQQLREGRDAAIKAFGQNVGMTGIQLRRILARGDDPRNYIRGYDQFIHDQQADFPALFQDWKPDARGLLVSGGTPDNQGEREYNFFQNVARSNRELTPPPIHETDILGQIIGQYAGDEQLRDDEEAIPFRKRRHYYRKALDRYTAARGRRTIGTTPHDQRPGS